MFFGITLAEEPRGRVTEWYMRRWAVYTTAIFEHARFARMTVTKYTSWSQGWLADATGHAIARTALGSMTRFLGLDTVHKNILTKLFLQFYFTSFFFLPFPINSLVTKNFRYLNSIFWKKKTVSLQVFVRVFIFSYMWIFLVVLLPFG